MKKLIRLLLLLVLTSSSAYSLPKVSIITSMYKGEKYIRHFLDEISKQTIYSSCEHIIINANSPENEEPVILEYCEKFPNIRYIKLDFDPGLYAVWNIGLLMSEGEYITNANLDDRFDYTSIEELLKVLEGNPTIDLVYSDLIFTKDSNISFCNCNVFEYHTQPEFSLENVIKYCSPGNHPLWRKSLHLKYGLFDTSYKIIGDHEFWIRCAAYGAHYERLPKFLAAFYLGENSLSYSKEKKLLRIREKKMLKKSYRDVWVQ